MQCVWYCFNTRLSKVANTRIVQTFLHSPTAFSVVAHYIQSELVIREAVTPRDALLPVGRDPSLVTSPQTFRSTHQVRYSCAEQYMMAEKAKLFGDETAWQEIIQTDDPRTHKRLGRGVHGYNQGTWDEHKKDIVTRGSYAKFSQNPVMGQYLLDTGEKVGLHDFSFEEKLGFVRPCFVANDERA